MAKRAKTRSPAQIAATKRMLAAAATKRKGPAKRKARKTSQRTTTAASPARTEARRASKARTPAQIDATKRMLAARGNQGGGSSAAPRVASRSAATHKDQDFL